VHSPEFERAADPAGTAPPERRAAARLRGGGARPFRSTPTLVGGVQHRAHHGLPDRREPLCRSVAQQDGSAARSCWCSPMSVPGDGCATS
jgi:hypothetical protein